MSDTLNALQEANRSSTVLQGIMNPAQVNPLSAMSAGVSAAGNVMKVQAAQGERLVGQALQQATDPDSGVLDTQKAQRIAAGMGPAAAYAMQDFLKTSSVLRGQQIEQVGGTYKLGAMAAGSAIYDPSDANLDNIRASMVSAGAPPGMLAEVDRLKTIPDLNQRKEIAAQHLNALVGAQHQLAVGGLGPATMENYGDVSAPTAIQQPRPGQPARAIVGAPVTQGVAPANTLTQKVPVDENGIIPLDANGNPTRTPKDYVDRPVPMAAAPGFQRGGQPAGQPVAGAPAAVPPPPSGAVIIKNGIIQPRVSPPAPNAATPPATTPPATAPPVLTSAPQRTVAGQEADQKQFIADRTVLPQRQTQEQNLQHAYDALKLVTSGRGTETASSIRNFLATVGALPAGKVNDEALYEIARKYTERTIADVGNAAGTDTGRAVAAASNPNVSLINPANLAFLRNDIGKVRQQMAPYMTAPDTTTGAGFGKHSANIASSTDYRGFNWDMYSPPEQKEIEKSVGKVGTPAHDALARAIGMGRALWPQKGPGPIVPHAEAAPIAPPLNAFAMAQPQSNPLLAAG